MEELTVEQHSDLMRLKITQFEIVWRQGMKDSPNQYPEKLSEGDWYEQFLAYMSYEGE